MAFGLLTAAVFAIGMIFFFKFWSDAIERYMRYSDDRDRQRDTARQVWKRDLMPPAEVVGNSAEVERRFAEIVRELTGVEK